MKLKLGALAIGLVAAGAVTAREYSTPVRAVTNGTSCFTVYHGHFPVAETNVNEYDYVVSDGIDGTTYKVEYRIRTISTPAWSSWNTPSESTEASTSNGVYGYRYSTSSHDMDTYDLVEWRLVTDEHEGTNDSTDLTMTSLDGDQNAITELASSTCTSGSWPDAGPTQWDTRTVFYGYDEEE